MNEVTAELRSVWWLVLLRGIFAILFGLYALFAPAGAVLTVLLVFAAYAIVDGVTALIIGVQNRATNPQWGWQIARGVIAIIAGIVAILWPIASVLAAVLVLVYLIGFWSIFGGIAEVVQAFTARKIVGGSSWIWVLIAGILTVILGIAVIVQPGIAAVTLFYFAAIFAILYGISLLVWAFQLRKSVDAVAELAV